jgi:zinc D-Ala-D-Ala dipeptidase
VKKRHNSRLIFLSTFLILPVLTLVLRAQVTSSANSSLLPGAQPAEAPLETKRLVGIYGQKPDQIILLERDGTLFYHDASGIETPIHESKSRTYEATLPGPRKIEIYPPNYKTSGSNAWPFIRIGEATYKRADGGGSAWFHLTPLKPVDKLREAALAEKPPAESGPFRKPELVELVTLDPAIHLEIRYAQTNNFLSTPVYTQARAFMQLPAAEALARALHKLQPLGYGLLIHDAYRPWYVTKIFWDATSPEDHIFVADPQKGSRHNRGCAVDLTLYDLTTEKAIEMPGMYDEMSPRSFPDFPGGTSLQRWHRDLLRRAMESEGFVVNKDEWWHFDFNEWKFYPILNVPFENLNAVSKAAD